MEAPAILSDWNGISKVHLFGDEPIVLFWVVFDNPQYSPLSDGPSEGAAVAAMDLMPLGRE